MNVIVRHPAAADPNSLPPSSNAKVHASYSTAHHENIHSITIWRSLLHFIGRSGIRNYSAIHSSFILNKMNEKKQSCTLFFRSFREKRPYFPLLSCAYAQLMHSYQRSISFGRAIISNSIRPDIAQYFCPYFPLIHWNYARKQTKKKAEKFQFWRRQWWPRHGRLGSKLQHRQ